MKLFEWLGGKTETPRWLVLFLFLISAMNLFIFLSIGMTYLYPRNTYTAADRDVVLGLHLQLFEAFLAALALGLAVFGVIGYTTIREAAERRADAAARAVAEAKMAGFQERADAVQGTPDYGELGNTETTREPEQGT